MYTTYDMQQLFNNRYTRLALLTAGLSALFFAILWLIAQIIGLKDFPVELEILVSVLGAGVVVYKFFAFRMF